MKRFQLFFIPIFTALAFFTLWPAVALADDPTDLCINGVISDTTYSFSNATLPASWIVAPESTIDELAGGGISVDDCDPMGEFVSNNYVKSIDCPWSTGSGSTDAVAVQSSGLSISSPISGTLTYFDFTADTTLYPACFHDGEWGYVTSGVIPAGWTCTDIWGGYAAGGARFERHIFDVTVTCGVGEYEAVGFTSCDLVPNADFTTSSDWLLSGSATITNGVLSLSGGDAAAQNLTGLTSNSSYDAVISVTDVVSDSTLFVVLGNEIENVFVSSTGIYNVSFTTPNLAGPLAFGFQINDGGIDIDYTCLSLASTGPTGEPQLGCLAPPNGDFSAATDWIYENGAAYNNALNAALLPLNDPATSTTPFYTPAFIQTENAFTLPTVITGTNLLLSFEAQSLQSDSGLITSLLQNQAQTVDYNFEFEVYPQKYVFEADVSDLTGETTLMLFGNDGGYPPAVDYPDDISLDNVCIFSANRGPNLPRPVDPDAIEPVTIGQFYSCSDLLGFFAGYGIDMRYHQDNYATTPSVWNPQDWVPWLISAAFVGLDVYLCAFFVALQSILNIIEYLLNNVLNYASFFRRNWDLFIPWLASYYPNALDSFGNFVTALRTTASDWLTWGSLAAVEFATVPNVLVSSLAVLLLGLTGGLGWLVFTQFPALFLWLVTEGNNVFRTLLNFLIDDVWNAGLRVGLGNLISAILDIFIGIWNTSLIPFLIQLLFGPLGLITLSLVSLIPIFWDLVWAVAMYLWVNVFQMIDIPFAFYTGLSAGVQSTAFSDLLSCDGSTLNFWCNFLAAIDLLNGITGQSVFYPIVIVMIVIATVAILWRNIIGLWNFYAEWLTRL